MNGPMGKAGSKNHLSRNELSRGRIRHQTNGLSLVLWAANDA